MAIKLSVSGSDKMTDPVLISFHNQCEAVCLELQKHLDKGYYSLSDAVGRIESFKERVRGLTKSYQDEKQSPIGFGPLYAQQQEILEEYQGYKTTYLKTLTLIEKIQKTSHLIEPAHRSRTDEKLLQEHLPFYYAELKLSESIFSKYLEQLKNTESNFSSLNHRLHEEINGKALKIALEKFRKIVEGQGTSSSKSKRMSYTSSYPFPPMILEPSEEQPRIPLTSPRHVSVSPKVPARSPKAISPEFLCSLSRGLPNSSDTSSSPPQAKRPSVSSYPNLSLSSPRSPELIRLSPLTPKRVEIVSPRTPSPSKARSREPVHVLQLAVPPQPSSRLIKSEGSTTQREKPNPLTSSSPISRYSPSRLSPRERFFDITLSEGSTSHRERFTALAPLTHRGRYSELTISSEFPRAHRSSQEEKSRRAFQTPSLDRKKYELDTSPPERSRRLHLPRWDRKKYEQDTPSPQSDRRFSNPFRRRKHYDNMDVAGPAYSGSHY